MWFYRTIPRLCFLIKFFKCWCNFYDLKYLALTLFSVPIYLYPLGTIHSLRWIQATILFDVYSCVSTIFYKENLLLIK